MKLFHVISTSILGAAMAIGVGLAVANARQGYKQAKADDEPYYSLVTTTATGGNETPHNSYTQAADAVVDGITWSVLGNSYMTPWRLGGKNTSNTDRSVYSKTAMSEAIERIVFKHDGTGNGKDSSITVNSIKLEVSSNSGFSNIIDTITTSSPSVSSAGTITYIPTSGDSWASGAYYRFTMNYKITGSNNCYLKFLGADFYKYEEPISSKTLVSIAVSGSMTKTTYSISDAWNPEGLVVTATYDDTSNKVVTGKASWTYNPAAPSSTSTTSVVATASYTEGGVTKTASSTAQAVTVTDKGTSSNPYTVAEARAAIDAGTGLENVYAKGIVSSIPYAYSTTNKNITFNLSDDGTTTANQLQAFKCSAASDPDVKVGDVITITGTMKKFNSTYEFDQGNTISLHSKITSLVVSTAPTKVSYNAGEQFKAAGLAVTASYNNGEGNHTFSYANHADNFELSPDNDEVLSSSDTSVSIKYGHGSTTQAIEVIVAPAVISISVNPTSKTILFDAEFTINATVVVEGGASQNVNWSIDDSSTLVSIKSSTSSSATIKANSSSTGTAVVRATSTADNTKSATCTIKVADPNALVDTLTYDLIGVSGTSYTAWSGIVDATAASYKGVTAGGNTSIQMNNTSAYIANTGYAGYIRSLEFTFEAHTTNDRTITVYGADEAFETKADVSGGTELGTITYKDSQSTYTINVDAIYEYKYFGILAGGGALYLDEIVVTYEKIDTNPSILVLGSTSLIGKEGGSDSTSTSIKVKNISSPVFTFTFDEDGHTGQDSSNYVRANVGTPTDSIYPLAINFDHAGSTKINIDVSGQKASIDVTVVEASKINVTLSAQYRQVFDASTLKAGDQIIIADNNSDNTKDKMMNGTIGKYAGASAATFTNEYISNSNISDAMIITLGGTSGAWTLSYGSSKYLAADSSKDFVEGTSADTWTISIENGDATITYMTAANGYIMHNVSSTRFKPYTSAASSTMRMPQIYRYVSGAKQIDVDSDLLTAIGSAESAFTCNDQGTSFDVSAFNSMSAFFSKALMNKYYLDTADAKDAKEGGTVVENFLARYDYVMQKREMGYEAYATAEDFLGRVSSGKVQPTLSVQTASNANTIITIVIITSVIVLTSVGCFFIIRRKKHN